METPYIITIGRQLGSGGKRVGELLAAQFGISCYDKELIQIASEESGLGKDFFEKVDEKSRFSLFVGLLGLRSNYYCDDYSENYLSKESLFKILSDVMRELAKEQPCIFVGHCSDYILRDHPRCINIFITADTSDRLRKISENQNISVEAAQELMERSDKERSGYYNYYTNKVWGAASSYHLCVNTSLLGIEETVKYIRAFVERFLVK